MENEERLIKANELMATVEGINWYHIDKLGYLSDGANSQYHTPIYKAEDIYNAIKNAPTVDAVEMVHAKWEYNGRNDEYFCSNCYKQPISFKREMNCGVGEFVEVCFSDYCPNCGAKMDGGNENVNLR